MSDTTLRNLVSHLKKCTDALPPEVQQIVTDVALTSDRQEAKVLHAAVHKLSAAKKTLTSLRHSRWQMHAAWTGFLQQATTNWQAYVKDFGEQDQQLQEQINGAKGQLTLARAHLHQFKEKATAGEEVEEVSDDDTIKNEVGKEITEGLTTMKESLEQLKHKAEHSVEEMQQPSKARKTSAAEGVHGEATASKPSVDGSSALPASMTPFPTAVK